MASVQRNTFIILLICLTAGFAIRLYQLDHVSFRGDEAFVAQYWANVPLSFSLSEIITIEPFPPLAYVFFRAWGIVAESNDFALRYFPALFGMIAIAGAYAAGTRLLNHRAGWLAAAITAFNPYLIWHARDLRPYAIWAALSIVIIWLALRILQRRKPNAADWWLYGVLALVSSMFYYFEIITLGILVLFSWTYFRQHRRRVIIFTAINSAIAVCGAISVLIFQRGLIASGSYGGISQPLYVEDIFRRFVPELIFGYTLPYETRLFVGLAMIATFAAAGVILWREKPRAVTLTALLIIIPIAAVGVVAKSLNTVDPRYAQQALWGMTLLIAPAAVTAWQHRKITPRAIVAFGTVATLILAVISIWNLFANPAFQKANDWREINRFLSEHVTAGDLVIQSTVDAAFGYYYAAAGDEIALPAAIDQPADEITARLEEFVPRYEYVWVIARSGADWENADTVPNWLSENMQPILALDVAGIPVEKYAPADIPPDEFDYFEQPVNFGDIVQASGAAFEVLSAENTQQLLVRLYWEPITRTDSPLTVFVHVVAVNGNDPPVAQSDAPPQSGQAPTTSWDTGTLLRDAHQIDISSLPAGEYEILVGLYDPETFERLHTQTGDDAVSVGTFLLPE